MMQRLMSAQIPAANNKLRMGWRPLLILAYSGLVLVALSGAFLLGLAAVGLLAGVIAGLDLTRRHLWGRVKPLLGAFEHQVIGYQGRP